VLSPIPSVSATVGIKRKPAPF